MDFFIKKLKSLAKYLIGFLAVLALFLTNIETIIKFGVSHGFFHASSKNRISVNYLRLFGATEVPLLIQAISTGGIRRQEKTYLMGDEDVLSGTKKIFYADNTSINSKYSGNIYGELGKYWFEKFEYKNSIPISNYLWEQCLNANFFGIKLLGKASKSPAKDIACCLQKSYWMDFFCSKKGVLEYNQFLLANLSEYLTNKNSPFKCKFSGEDFPEPVDDKQLNKICSENNTYHVGFLFVIIENISKDVLKDIAIEYKEFSPNDLKCDVFDNIENDKITSYPDFNLHEHSFREYSKIINKKSILKKIPILKPNRSLIWLLSIYQARGKDQFEEKFLENWQLPVLMSYTIDDVHRDSLYIRLPLRNSAMHVNIPHGWYGQ